MVGMKKIGVLVMALVMMGGLVGCGTKFEQTAVQYDMVGGLFGPVGTVLSVGAAGVVTAVDAVTPQKHSRYVDKEVQSSVDCGEGQMKKTVGGCGEQ